MQSAKISELKDNLSRFLAYVKRGGTVRVFDRDKPVAELVPFAGASMDDSLLDLEREGVIRRGSAQLSADFLRRKLPSAKSSLVRALLDERTDGR